jgi:hypothetical protein
MAVRAYTSGYDLFHPHMVLAWHHYGRNNNKRHWDDNEHWTYRNQRSLNHYMFSLNEKGNESISDNYPYGLGISRTLLDYELYSGVCLSIRKATSYAISGDPPHQRSSHESLTKFIDDLHSSHSIFIKFPEELLSIQLINFEFIYIGAHAAGGEELIRRDLYGQDMQEFEQQGSMMLSFCSVIAPSSYTIWPYSLSSGWTVEKITIFL